MGRGTGEEIKWRRKGERSKRKWEGKGEKKEGLEQRSQPARRAQMTDLKHPLGSTWEQCGLVTDDWVLAPRKGDYSTLDHGPTHT